MQFQIAGSTHYGWVQLSAPLSRASVTVHGYAYETVANTAIAAGDVGVAPIPEPNSLALFACGAAGLVAWRRKKRGTSAA